MQEDRVNGQIASTAKKRRNAFEHATWLMPIVQQARSEILADGRSVTLRAVADWLNARDHKTIRGRVFRAQTVSTLLSPEDGQKKAADAVFERESYLLNKRFGRLTESDRVARGGEFRLERARLKGERDRIVAEGEALGRAMRAILPMTIAA